MFTGLVEEVGRIKKLASGRLEIASGLDGVKIGDSLAVNGACLTVAGGADGIFSFELLPYTLKDTAFAELSAGAEVNLERAVPANGRFGGHFVSGHIDEAGIVSRLSGGLLTVSVRPEHKIYLAPKGSVAVNGVSLTMQAVRDREFTVNLVGHTLQNTMLRNLRTNDKVNIEYDLLFKYLQKLLPAKPGSALRKFLF
ncbi:MAG: riboflavin synthase [Candidatus Margulisbacteria bacterium]|jgi:riboflavin synthase|nr:riboflavin synthase [Candidatus Margulisiibacteriota bacterium]